MEGVSFKKCNDSLGDLQTNADRIRSMSDEELAEFFSEKMDCAPCPASEEVECGCDRCVDLIKEWLKREVEE